jgi:hypothetical protein
MKKLENPICPKCGEIMRIYFVKDRLIEMVPNGMQAECPRCLYSQSIKSLDELDEELNQLNK